ncbi:hypothetical protein NDK43_13785 [Neobacillus pocheonensis]|uniref:Uncharacterized protein n=1 Tax=Neobacillus pocheonensis TaxID=363869 RepID=A0ABT0WB61_9BACI|nr:hypothetical protein [Neobacillus pocheonensis]
MKKKFLTIPVLSIGLLSMSVPAFAANPPNTVTVPSGYKVSMFGQDGTATNPDDITRLGDHIFIGYQNGVGSDGKASATGNTKSTIIEYNLSGEKIKSWTVTGKCDGLTADPNNNRLLATANEDGNSTFYVIYPNANQVKDYTYNPAPDAPTAAGTMATGGGTDAITIQNGKIYISASNPSDVSKAALFQATLDDKTNTVKLQTVFTNNATAKDAVTGQSVTLGLTDNDSNKMVPAESPRFAGDFMLDGQADKQLIFAKKIGTPNQSLTRLAIDAPVDDTAWATSQSGTLLVSDTSANTVYAIKGNFTKGQAFVAIPGGDGTPANLANKIGTLDLATGHIQAFASGLNAPHGLLFIPDAPSAPSQASTTKTSTTVQPASKKIHVHVVIPNTAFWQAKGLVSEFEKRGLACRGVNLKTYGKNEVPKANDPYQFVIDTTLDSAKQLVIELKTRGYHKTYGEAI